MDALSLCMFLKLRVYFVEIVNLVGLACPVADHMGYGNYAITYADNQMEIYLIVTLIKCAIKQKLCQDSCKYHKYERKAYNYH